MKKDFNTGLRKGIEADRVKLTRRRKLLLREMGGQPHTMAFQHYRSHSCVPVVCTVGKLLRPVPFIYVIIN